MDSTSVMYEGKEKSIWSFGGKTWR